MAKTDMMPVSSATRRRRNTGPTSSSRGDTTVIRYKAVGTTITSTSDGVGSYSRLYIGGYGAGLNQTSGPDLASYYSTCRFEPGTSVRWEPNVSFTTSGRIYVAFTDNAEVMVAMVAAQATFVTTPTLANYNAYANLVKGCGSVMSFPVWKETAIPFPLKYRRKRFDCNEAVTANVDVLDRSAQTAMFVAFDGGPASATNLGSMLLGDVLSLEGIHPVIT